MDFAQKVGNSSRLAMNSKSNDTFFFPFYKNVWKIMLWTQKQVYV